VVVFVREGSQAKPDAVLLASVHFPLTNARLCREQGGKKRKLGPQGIERPSPKKSCFGEGKNEAAHSSLKTLLIDGVHACNAQTWQLRMLFWVDDYNGRIE